jgi:hypothetical protein
MSPSAPASNHRAQCGLPDQPPSGHVYRVARKRGAVWYAKYRLPDGRQVKRRLGPAWSERQRPPAGYFTKRLAETWLRDTLDQAHRGTLAISKCSRQRRCGRSCGRRRPSRTPLSS